MSAAPPAAAAAKAAVAAAEPAKPQYVSTQGAYLISGNQVGILTKAPEKPTLPVDSIISILAAPATPTLDDGLVDIRGNCGVRITAGKPIALPTHKSVKGLDVAVQQDCDIKMKRGLLPTDQTFEMTSAGIKINAGSMPVTIESLKSITLSVAGGTSKITIDEFGIKIEGLMIQLKAIASLDLKSDLAASLDGAMTTTVAGSLIEVG